MTDECYLKVYMDCGDGSSGAFCNVGGERLKTASRLRGDGLHEQLLDDLNTKYKCHKKCVSSYTSSLNAISRNMTKQMWNQQQKDVAALTHHFLT